MKKFTRTLLYLAVFTLPFGMGVQSDINFYISKLFVVFSLLFSITQILKKHQSVSYSQRGIRLFIIYVFLHTLVVYLFLHSDEFSFGYTQKFTVYGTDFVEQNGLKVIRFCIFFLFSYSIIKFLNTEKELSRLINYFSLGYLFSILVNIRPYIYTIFYSPTLRYWGSTTDPNALGLLSSTLIILNVYLVFFKRNRVSYLLSITFIVTGSTILILTGSRSALVGLFFGLLLIFYKRERRGKIIFLLLIIFLIVFKISPKTSTLYFKERMGTQHILKYRGSQRLNIWESYLSKMNYYYLSGVGMGRSATLVKGTINEGRTCHNTFLTIFVEYGFVGLLLIIVVLIQIIKRLYKLREKNKIYIAAILVLLIVNSFFSDIFFNRITWLVFPLIISYINFSKLNEA